MGRPVAVALLVIGGLLLLSNAAVLLGAGVAYVLAADGALLMALGLFGINVDGT